MTWPAEQEAGITFAELGIDLGNCRSATNCVVFCPRCHHTRTKPENRRKPEMSVNPTNGTWTCHHCSWVSGLNQEAREAGRQPQRQGAYQGARTVTTQRNEKPRPEITHATPVAESELPAGCEQWGLDWLRDRGISEATARAFDIRTSHNTLHFPYYNDGKLVNVKRRGLPKDFRQSAGGAKSLFNIDRAAGQELIVIAEGELDVMACHECAWTAVSLQDGAPGVIVDKATGRERATHAPGKVAGLYDAKAQRVLGEARRIVIATDGDTEGRALQRAILDALGKDAAKCWAVTWPADCKDANDVLIRYGPQVLDETLGEAKPVDLPGITRFMDEYAAVHDIWLRGYDPGVSTGWPQMDELFRPRLGSIILMTGVPSNGKTTWLHALFGNLANQHDWKFGVFSPESGDDGSLFAKLIQVAADAPLLPGADGHMSEETLRAAATWVDAHFYRVDASRADEYGYQTITLLEIVERLESLVLRYGIKGAIVDPWNRLEAVRPNGMTETEYVAWAINMLSRFAQRHQVAVFVVAHPHKLDVGRDGEDEPMPSPYNIAGSAHWYNMADVILGIKRNKYVEPRDVTTVRVWKMREEGPAGKLGWLEFHYDGRSRRYHVDAADIPQQPGTRPFMATAGALAGAKPTAAADDPWHMPGTQN